MRNILIAVLLLFGVAVNAQLLGADVIKFGGSVTTAVRDGLSPDEGWLIYNVTTGQHEYYDGLAWSSIGEGIQWSDPVTSSLIPDDLNNDLGSFALPFRTLWIDDIEAADLILTPILKFSQLAYTDDNNGDLWWDDPADRLIFRESNTEHTLAYLSEVISKNITGRTGTDVDALLIQTQSQYDSDGAVSAGQIVVLSDASPMTIIADADWTGAIDMDGWKGTDDSDDDVGTFTFSNLDPGDRFTVWINRASAPTLSGGTFNLLPNTTAFSAATDMGVYFEVGIDGTTVDYFYYER